jgi:peptidyl-prolyl cis-trans isomerase SurA
MQVVHLLSLAPSVSCVSRSRWLRSSLALMTIVTMAAACRSTPGAAPGTAVTADTYAMVNGRPITRDEVEKAYRRNAPATPVSQEEASSAKLSLLNDLIVQDLLLDKARELKLELPESELDAAYGEAKKNIPDESFQAELKQRDLTPADMREGLRRELLTQKVMEREVTGRVAVSDQEVTDFFNANRAQFNFPEEAYHVAQIVVTPVPDQQRTNRSGDDATTPQAATAKTQMLMERLKGGASFRDLAMDYSEDPESAPRGGDLGFVPVSRLKQAPPALRDAVLQGTPGSVRVVSAGGGHSIVLVVAHEQAGQRDLSVPAVRDQITSTLRGRKEQLLRAAYLTAMRSDASVVNYYARQLVESQSSKAPTLAPTAPGKK